MKKYLCIWDESKNIKNKGKHKIGFEVADIIINDPNTTRWVVREPEKWDKPYDGFKHNFPLPDSEIKKLAARAIFSISPDLLNQQSIDEVFKSFITQDIIRDQWIGVWNDKYWSVISVLRLPYVRIISLRRAKPEEIESHLSFKKITA